MIVFVAPLTLTFQGYRCYRSVSYYGIFFIIFTRDHIYFYGTHLYVSLIINYYIILPFHLPKLCVCLSLDSRDFGEYKLIEVTI